MKSSGQKWRRNDLVLPLVADDKEVPARRIHLLKTPSGWQRPKKLFVTVLGFVSLWWLSAITVIIEIKRTVERHGIYPHPFAMTSIVQVFTALSAFLLSKVAYRKREAPPPFSWREVSMLIVLGTLQGVEIGLTNKALEYLPVATRTMVNSSSVLFTMATAHFWGLERMCIIRLIAACLIVAGGVFQGFGQRQEIEDFLRGRHETGFGANAAQTAMFQTGFGIQLVAMLLAAQRWALTQFVLQCSPPDSALGKTAKLQLMMRTLPVTGLVCFLLAQIFEPTAFSTDNLLQSELFMRIPLASIAVTAMVYAELKLVNMLSAVAFNVLSTVHQIPIVLAGILLEHNEVDRLSACGFGICIAGALVYAAERHTINTRELACEMTPRRISPFRRRDFKSLLGRGRQNGPPDEKPAKREAVVQG